MNEVESMRERVLAAHRRFQALPVAASDAQGPPDPKTGERWDRYNVLGHVAEMLPFWSAQLTHALEGASVGREPGSAQRLEGIESGRLLGETALRERIDTGVDDLLRLLDRLQPADLDRKVNHLTRGEETMRWALEYYLVGHYEEHVTQVTDLTPS